MYETHVTVVAAGAKAILDLPKTLAALETLGVPVIGYGTDDARFEATWPADVHVIGKDITRFHCALWPAMLMSAGLPLPRQVFAHGFVYNKSGKKESKSAGATDPMDYIDFTTQP